MRRRPLLKASIQRVLQPVCTFLHCQDDPMNIYRHHLLFLVLPTEFNSKCASSGISVSIPQAASTASATGAPAGGSAPASATGGSATVTSLGSGSTAAPTSGTSSGNSTGTGGSTGSNQSGGSERLVLGSSSLAAGLLILIINKALWSWFQKIAWYRSRTFPLYIHT